MKTVVMTVGPQGAGKTTYCQNVVTANPGVKFLSVDLFFMERFGKIGFDPYTGEVNYAWNCFWEYVEQSLKQAECDATILLDCWNPTASARRAIRERLKTYGAQRIVAWYFVTPSEVCGRWFSQRTYQIQNHWTAAGRVRDALRFYEEADDVRKGIGFDSVHTINILQLQLFPHLYLL